jgi:hypothetical protein
MISDGLTQTSDPYLAAQAMASQEVHSSTLKVFSRSAANVENYTFTPTDLTVGHTVGFSLTYLGVVHVVSYTVVTSDDAADIVTGLKASLGTISGLTIGGSTTLTIVLTDATDGERFYIHALSGLTVSDTSTDAGIATDLASAQAADSDFYGVLIDSTSAAEIAAAAAWCLSNTKIMGASCLDADCVTDDNGVAYDLNQLTNHRCYVLVTKDSAGHGHAGLMSGQFAIAPGADNWAHKAISGQLPDAWTQGELTYARANGAITYIQEYGFGHSLDGWACSKRYLDLTRGVDWIVSSLKAACMAVWLNNTKIAYTDSGAALFEGAIRGVLGAAESVGFLAPGWTVTRPRVADQSLANRAARAFPNITWAATAQGAIQSATVNGEIVL